ncbi:MAG: UDP-N-acetylmuramate dehydrogenase [Deltaproteobacteria bacterium]|nr:UDP-N-acetylmuramate dehydrogenase [Deltaproteobacteria bacterium]
MDLAGRIGGLGLEGSFEERVPLAGLTSYQIGGPAELLVEPASIADAEKVVGEVHRAGVPLTVIGAGSNVLVSDEGLEGVVMRVGARMGGIAIDAGVITAGAGVSDRDLAHAAARAGITCFEFLEDIPGSLGGGLVQNAEAWGDAISDHLVDVTVVDATGRVVTYPARELEFGYRDSTFKRAGDLVIVEARFAPGGRAEPSDIMSRMDELRARRHARYPLDHPSCGSVFKRPEGDYAGRLIEVAGLGGTRVGDACVSRLHHNFIVNLGGATARDVRTLVEQVQQVVHDRFGVHLERELVYLGPA